MKWIVGAYCATVVTIMMPASAATKDQLELRPQIFTELLQCRNVIDKAERLDCYDRRVGDLDAAAGRDELVLLDKDGLKKTRRSLFGFSLPRLPFLGGREQADDADAQVNEISANIDRAIKLPQGRWEFRLNDGSQWQSTEEIAGRVPKPGLKIVVKRGAMGSFIGRIEDWRSFKMKRIG